MKKTLSLIVCLLMLLSAFAACNTLTDNDDSSAPDSSEVSDGNFGGDTDVDRLLSISLPSKRSYIDVAEGASYTFSREPHEKYKDGGNFLTDPASSDPLKPEEWVGFIGKDDIEITLDLGKTVDGICGFSIDILVDMAKGRSTPRLAELYASTDGENYVKAASGAEYSVASGSAKVSTLEAYTEKGFSARYIKLRLSDMVVNWAFLNSFRVYTCVEKTGEQQTVPTGDTYYINNPLPKVDSDLYWDSSDSDYTKSINLIKGLPQIIHANYDLNETHRTEYYNTPASTKVLTDGRHGGSDYKDPAYAHFTGGEGRDIIYDIGKLSTVKTVKVSTMVFMYGIETPEMVFVSLSEDGEDWQRVAVGRSSEFVSVTSTRSEITLDLNVGYKARFVKVSIKNSTHCWMDEITVLGTKEIASDAKKLEGESASIPEPVIVNEYPSLDVLGGSENIYLAYNYRTENPESGLRNKEQYKPLVGYYDTDKKLKDFFFDSFLYLPCSTTAPSGGVLWENEEKPSLMTDWLDYYDDLFKDGYNIKALNEAVGEVKTELGQPDYQAYVYFSIFSMPKTNYAFGDVDGDGIMERGNSLEDRKKAAKWWIDLNIDTFKKGNFSNLKLNGFYWYDESIGLGSSDQREYVQYVVNYLHDLGYYVIWIPYHMAGGYSSWKEVGFDCANMQPNYVFNDEVPESRLYVNAELAKKYGMGVEIEADGRVVSDGSDRYDRYLAYLRTGVETGYMNTIKMYYFDAVPGVMLSAYETTDPKYHQVYDLTYLYAKRKLTLDGDFTISEEPIQVTANTKVDGDLQFESLFCTLALKYSPRHGSFSLTSEGKYKYKPDADYVGEDYVILSVKCGLTEQEYTVRFNVTAAE